MQKTMPGNKIETSYKTQNVFLIVMDGPRYSETWGDPLKKNIPNIANKLAVEGATYTRFYNDGVTNTNPGHVALCTGLYQNIDNEGNELPIMPSFFQLWIKQKKQPANKAWIVASKDKLEVLANTNSINYTDRFMPETNCGIDGKGLGSGYRHDSITFAVAKDIIQEHHPQLMLIQFREPDFSGHNGNWEKYLAGIKDVDNYIYLLWSFIQNNPFYKDKTALYHNQRSWQAFGRCGRRVCIARR